MKPERFHHFEAQPFALAWYKDELYIGGHFRLLEDFSENNIARWDGNDWQSVGGGLGLTNFGCGWAVNDMVVYKGELYIGGCFYLMPAQVAGKIVKWDGNEYKALGAEEPGAVDHMVVFNDELYMAGHFSALSEIGETDIFKWDGSRWCSLGSIFSGKIDDMEVFNSELYVSGDFKHVNGEPLRGVVKWIGGDYVAACGTPVSANETVQQNNIVLQITPNPAFQKITLELNQPINIKNAALKIFNATGEVVFKKEIIGQEIRIEINTSIWPPSLYLATLEAGGQVWTEKVVVQQ